MRTKDIPTLGTTFCCRVKDAATFIPEIPLCHTSAESEPVHRPSYTKNNFDTNNSLEESPIPPRSVSDDEKDYLQLLYENLGKLPYDRFVSKFEHRNFMDYDRPRSFGAKTGDLENKVQRDLTSFYAKTPVEVHSFPYRSPEIRQN